jgi:pilus assembly protein FimV
MFVYYPRRGGIVRKDDQASKIIGSILAVALAVMPLGAGAAGLGKLNVLSALGQPLRAELEITATREELSSLAARLASPDAFAQSGIEYVPALSGLRFTVDKHGDGRLYLRVTSDRPVNEPFLDMLVELTWAQGRLVREYTFLLDPPEGLAKSAAPSVSLPEARPPAAAAPTAAPEPTREVAAPQAPSVAPEPAAGVAPAPTPAAEEKPAATPAERAAEAVTEKPAAEPSEKPSAQRGEKPAERRVKRGDTLSKIAREVLPQGADLDQVLVALFERNKEAFDAENMHRLKAGKILAIPDAGTMSAVDKAEAQKTIAAHTADFNTYRKKLAAAAAAASVAKEETAKQGATGKIAAKVEEVKPAKPAADKLQVSQTASPKEAKVGAGGRRGVAEEDVVAREKALSEERSRVAALEKTISDEKKLAELKSQHMAELQKQAQANKDKAAAEKAAAEKLAADKAAADKAAAEKAAAEKAAAEKASAEKAAAEKLAADKAAAAAALAKPAESETKPAAGGAPVSPPEAAKPAEAPVKKPIVMQPPAPLPEPSFVDENPELVYGGGGILALVLAYLGLSVLKRKRQAASMGPVSQLTEGDLTANSVFGTTGGQRVDTSNSSIQTDFSQSGMGAIDTDEGVDPVAEADVYMAYGRDAQAEEILLDALKNDPNRHAIHLKLLEIYAVRKSVKQFETLASELYSRTSGIGADWEKAAAMGRDVDPENPLYASKLAAELAPAAEAPAAAEPLPIEERDTVTLPGQLAQRAGAMDLAQLRANDTAEAVPGSLDFDLDLDSTNAAAAETQIAPSAAGGGQSVDMDMDIDLGFDGGSTTITGAGRPHERVAPSVDFHRQAEETLDFNLDLPNTDVKPGLADPFSTLAPSVGDRHPEFEIGTTTSAVPPGAGIDLSGIDLTLRPPAPSVSMPAPAPAAAARLESAEDAAQEVVTKLELAQAYEEMGDKEGARELLQEVLAEGNSQQKETARNKLLELA